MTTYIIQRRIQEYRVGIFERMNSALEDLVIITETPPNRDVSFRWEIVSRHQFLGLNYTDLPMIKKGDVLISGIELSNLSHWLLLLRFRKRFVLWGHGFGRRRFSIFARPIRVFAAWLAGAAIFYTDGGRYAFSKYIKKEKLFVANNTIALRPFESIESKARSTFLYFGDLRAEKGVDVLIRAFSELDEGLSQKVKLVIVGDGPEKERLFSLATSTLSGDRVEFHPRTNSPDELCRFLDEAIATVSPKHVGLSVIQSFWAGVPIITRASEHHAPEFEHCTHNQNCLIYRGGLEGLKSAMLSISDPETRSRLSVNASAYYSEHLSIQNMIKGFESAIGHVTKLHPASRG